MDAIMEVGLKRSVAPPGVRTSLTILLLGLLLGGCGNDGFIFIAVNTGFVVSNGACDGQFNMRNDGGLTILVVIGSGTAIFLSNGAPGTCGHCQRDPGGRQCFLRSASHAS